MEKNLIDAQKEIERFVEENLKDDSLFLVEVRISTGKSPKVTVILDGDQGVTIESCSAMSRQLGNYIEEEEILESSYLLDVSSPGVDTPLSGARQYRKNIGRNVKVKMAEDVVKGKLEAVNETGIVVQEKGTKKKPGQKVEIEFNNILSTIVQVSFK